MRPKSHSIVPAALAALSLGGAILSGGARTAIADTPATQNPAPAAQPARPVPSDGEGAPEALKRHRHDDERRPEPKPFGLGESNTDYFWRKADVAFHAGDYPRAIALHKAIVALDRSDVESYSVASWLMWSLGNGQEALAHIRRGLDANPANWEMHDAAGSQYNLQKEYALAQQAFAEAVRLIPAGEDAHLLRRRLAHAAEHAGDLKLSASTWRGLVRDYPDDAVNRNNLARVEKLSGLSNVGFRAWPGAVMLSSLALGPVQYFRLRSSREV